MTNREAKLLESFKQSVKEGNYYESHQRALTIIDRKVLKKEYKIAINFLLELVAILKKDKIFDSMSDLAIKYIQIIKKVEKPNIDDIIDNSVTLLDCFEQDSPLIEKFIQQTLALTIEENTKFGNPGLYWHYGNYYYNLKKYDLSLKYFVHSDSGKEAGEIIAILAKENYNNSENSSEIISETEILLGHTVFEYLCQGFSPQAGQCLKLYNNKYNQNNQKLNSNSESIMCNFLKFLLESINSNLHTSFLILLEKYSTIWQEIDNGFEYLNVISIKNFKDKLNKSFNPNKSKNANPLGDMMSSLFGNSSNGQNGLMDMFSNMSSMFDPSHVESQQTNSNTENENKNNENSNSLYNKVPKSIPKDAKGTDVEGMIEDNDLD